MQKPNMKESIAENMKGRQAAATIVSMAQEEAKRLSEKARLRFWECVADGAAHHLPTPNQDEPMTDVEAARFGQELIDFGRYEGRRIDDIPLDYLSWVCDTQGLFAKKTHRYLRSQRTKQETK